MELYEKTSIAIWWFLMDKIGFPNQITQRLSDYDCEGETLKKYHSNRGGLGERNHILIWNYRLISAVFTAMPNNGYVR